MSSLSPFRAARLVLLAAPLCLTSLHAQEPNPTTIAPGAQSADIVAEGINGTVTYHIKPVEHELDAINFRHRGGSTYVEFLGTNLLPKAKATAIVESQRGGLHIDVNFKGLPPANGFGTEYLTYVFWAISADGRPQNLGEVLPSGTRSSLSVSTSLQSFGMIVTAEPYFSVSQPSDVIVLQAVFTKITKGDAERVNIHVGLLPRGLYAATEGSRTVLRPITRNGRIPLEYYEAHNAARIASEALSDKYAPDIMAEVNADLKNVDSMESSKHRDEKQEVTIARQAVQRAEDARIASLRKQADERQKLSQQAQLDAQKAQLEAAQKTQQALIDTQKAQLDVQKALLDAAQERAKADAAAAAQARAESDKARSDAAAAAARDAADAAQKKAAASQQDAESARDKLRAQLNKVLSTTDSARGLIVNLSDVLFDTGKYALKPATQVALAKVAIILELYPGLRVQVEGFTDSVGTDASNLRLSQNRATTVQSYLVQNGVPSNKVTATGFGAANPISDNSTVRGRSLNRRVNLVVSGDAIGVHTSAPQ